MFVIKKDINNRQNYISNIIDKDDGSFTLEFTVNVSDAKQFTLEQCFEIFQKYQDLYLSDYVCIEIPITSHSTKIF